MGREGRQSFCITLEISENARKIEIINSNINGEAARAICELLPSVERIKSLHFYHNESGDDAAEVLSELVEKCIALEDFDFAGNDIGFHGGMALVWALRKGSRLKTLNLIDSNRMFGKRGRVALSQVISVHVSLTEVYFSYMNLEDEGVIAIADSIKDAALSLRALMVAGNESLQKLNHSKSSYSFSRMPCCKKLAVRTLLALDFVSRFFCFDFCNFFVFSQGFCFLCNFAYKDKM